MLSNLLIPFQYEYMVKAILVSGFIGGVCALLSCFVVLKGWSLLYRMRWFRGLRSRT